VRMQCQSKKSIRAERKRVTGHFTLASLPLSEMWHILTPIFNLAAFAGPADLIARLPILMWLPAPTSHRHLQNLHSRRPPMMTCDV
jgi:hypothetical protein